MRRKKGQIVDLYDLISIIQAGATAGERVTLVSVNKVLQDASVTLTPAKYKNPYSLLLE